jgi:hypothetical protein
MQYEQNEMNEHNTTVASSASNADNSLNVRWQSIALGYVCTVVFCCAVQAKCFITRDKRERTHPDQHLERGRILNIP